MADAPLLMPDEIVNVTFHTTRFRPGYDQDQVDHYLDAVVATMRATIAGRSVPEPITAASIATTTFEQTRFRDGYAPEEVDAFLDRVHATLVALESGLRPA